MKSDPKLTDRQSLEKARSYVKKLREDIEFTLKALAGESVKCSYCDMRVYFCATRREKKLPIEPTGRVHFANCPGAQKAKERAHEKAGEAKATARKR